MNYVEKVILCAVFRIVQLLAWDNCFPKPSSSYQLTQVFSHWPGAGYLVVSSCGSQGLCGEKLEQLELEIRTQNL